MADAFDWEKVRTYWMEEAQEALDVSENLYEKNNYSYSLFFGHLAVEKYLKAVYVMKKEEHAPHIHNLERLAQALNVDITPERKEALIRISTFNIETRYPDIDRNFRKKCTPEFTRKELENIREICKWIKSIKKY